MDSSLASVYAAALTFRTAEGGLDRELSLRHGRFLLESGVDGVVVNGATGEYPATPGALFDSLVEAAAELNCPGGFLAGVGAADLESTLRLARTATRAGARAVLLPGPFFFRYSQDDIAHFCRTVAAECPVPIVLYNLPQFTNGYEPATAVDLVRDVPSIIGIKDSSGSLDILRDLTGPDGALGWRAVGNDQVLAAARAGKVSDAAISGVAAVLPELIVQLVNEPSETDRHQAAAVLLEEYLDQLQRFPTPWGIRWTAEYRGFGTARFLIPPSPHRQSQEAAFRGWFGQWWSRAESILAAAAVGL